MSQSLGNGSSQSITLTTDQLDQLIGKISAEVARQLQGGQAAQQPGSQLQVQGIFDTIGHFISSGPGQQVIQQLGPQIGQAAQGFLGSVLSMFANDPQFQQHIRQQVSAGQVQGVSPQGIFGDIGNWFKQAVPTVVRTVGPMAVQALPGILAALSAQPQFQPQGAQPGFNYMGNTYGGNSYMGGGQMGQSRALN